MTPRRIWPRSSAFAHRSPGGVRARGVEDARKVYVQGCLKLLERGERLPNRVLLLLADELGWGAEDS